MNVGNNDEDIDDFYDDVDIMPSSSSSSSSKANTAKLQTDITSSTTTSSATLQSQVTLLEKENQVLKVNIATLFRTAKAELRRKDKQIERLNEELRMKGSGC